MPVLTHQFPFPGHLSQFTYPDLNLTTHDCGGRSVPAHRVVLAAVSDKLGKMCQEGGKVGIRNIKFGVLKRIIGFIYNGRVELEGKEEVEDFRDGMDMLRVEGEIVEESDERDKNDNIPLSDRFFSLYDENKQYENNKDTTAVNIVNKAGLFEVLDELENCSPHIMEDCPETISELDEFKNTMEASNKKPEQNTESTTKMRNIISSSQGDRKSAKAKKVSNMRGIECSFCHKKVLYRMYVKHCEVNHPETSWKVKNQCGTCKALIPVVLQEFHQKIFAHSGFLPIIKEHSTIPRPIPKMSKPSAKSQIKVPCDYCQEQVTLSNYVGHCKRLHNISADDERCYRKCFKCGTKVHIIAEKFHNQIYHPVKPKSDPEPLKIVQHNKSLTKVRCDYCQDNFTFVHYKAHCRTKHPEVSYTEMVKCTKCGVKVAKIAFKYHKAIFHTSTKSAAPAEDLPSCSPKDTKPGQADCSRVKVEADHEEPNEYYVGSV